MGSTSSALFTGGSQFSQDFQNIITRAVGIASLPLKQLQNDLQTLQSQSDELTTIDGAFTALQSAVQGVQDAVSGASFQTVISDPDVIGATLSSGAIEGNYTVEVLDAGAYSKSLTTSSWVNQQNQPGQLHTYQLWVGDTDNPANEIDITPADNSAQSVAAAINAKASNKVRAVAVNVGTSGNPDWRISLRGTVLDNVPLDIVDNGTSLQTQTAGHKAEYAVDGCVPVYSTSPSVTIAAGVTVNLLQGDVGHPVDITVTRSTSALAGALTTFVDKYNAAVDAIDKERGQAGGALAGNSVVNGLSSVLAGVATYSGGSGQISGLRDLGLELQDNGHLTFNSLTLIAADFKNSTGVTTFFGTTDTGGFLKSVTDLLKGVQNPTTGILKTAESSVKSEIHDVNDRISAKQEQIDQLQMRLLEQMSAADAAIASMEQQYSYLFNMFQAMQSQAQQYR
jgi:flagellar hook-associated protein 2